MISNAFKKQLIVNNYKTQLLPITNEVSRLSIESFNYTKNWVLFKLDYKSIWLKYNYNNIIEYDINWLLHYLIYPTVSTHNIKNILNTKQNIDNRLDYTKYLEEVYD
jgi:hypothetical protein